MSKSLEIGKADSADNRGLLRRLEWRLGPLLGIDVRSLAALRIGLGLLLLFDLAARAVDVSAHYSDVGVLPRAMRIAMWEGQAAGGKQWEWSLHMLSGEAGVQLMLLGVAALAAVWLLLGYRTRLAAVASWLLLISLHRRNPLVLGGGDEMLRMLLFWAMFLPLGAAASLDNWLRQDRGNGDGENTRPRSVVSAAGIALLLQICLIYWASAMAKDHPVWSRDFTAIYYALHLDMFALGPGVWLRQFHGLTSLLTAATYYLEWVGPLMVFCPVYTGAIRVFVVMAFWAFHLGLALTMALGGFPYVAMVAWIVFLPGRWWDWWETRMSRSLSFAPRFPRLGQLLRGVFSHPERPRLTSSRWARVVVAVLFLYVLLWNLREMGLRPLGRSLPRDYDALARFAALDQYWNLFAPFPRRDDGWYVMAGALADGSQVNLWQPGRPLPYEKPARVSATYGRFRQSKYLRRLSRSGGDREFAHLSRWLTHRWNQHHTQDAPERRVRQVTIVFVSERTPRPGRPFAPPVAHVVWRNGPP